MKKAKKETTSDKWILTFAIFLLVILGIINYYQGKIEYVIYNILIMLLLITIYIFHKRIRYSNTLLLFLCIMIAFNLLGSNIKIDGMSLWDFKAGPVKYDNFVHTLSSFLAVFIVYNFVAPHVDGAIKRRPVFLALLLVLVTAGLGSLWEIVEFFCVIFIKTTTVGDYFNNALDLVCNLLGAIIGSVTIVIGRRKKKEF